MSFTYSPNDQVPTPGPATTLPNDGDALVVASVNAALESVLDNAAFLLLKGQGVNNAMNYGATGTGFDDTAAINAALAVPGITFLPPGSYHITSHLTVPANSSLVGCPGLTDIVMNHPTSDIIRLIGADINDGGWTPSVVSGIAFSGINSSNGQIFTDNATACNAIVSNCSVNETPTASSTDFLGGQLWGGAGASVVRFQNCTALFAPSAANPLIGVQSGQDVRVEGCRFVYGQSEPGTIAVDYEPGSFGHVTGCVFDFRNVTTGHPVGVLANSGIMVSGNTFYGTPVFVALQACVTWVTPGAKICIGPNAYVGCPTPFDGGTIPPTCGDESSIALVDRVTFGTSGFGLAVTTFTVPDGYACAQYFISATVPTYTLPSVLYPGQLLTVVMKNLTGSPWSSGPTVNVGAGISRTLDPVGPSGSSTDLQISQWVAVDMPTTGTFRWALQSVTTQASSF